MDTRNGRYQKVPKSRRPIFLLFFFLGCSRSVEAYANYTVGDSLGWYDKLLKPSVDYQKWAFSKSVSLGDFLIFNTDSNHSVIQTYNFTSCHSEIRKTPIHPTLLFTMFLSLFLSSKSNYDGEQCENGQRFEINVTHGRGLPASLEIPCKIPPAPFVLSPAMNQHLIQSCLPISTTLVKRLTMMTNLELVLCCCR